MFDADAETKRADALAVELAAAVWIGQVFAELVEH